MMTTTALPTVCESVVPGCYDCAVDPRAVEPHTCDDLCAMDGENKRQHAQYHQLRHTPQRHSRCGTVLDDRRGNNFEVKRPCPFGTCVVLFCPGCRRETGGWGPVECPACGGRQGHGTLGEFRRPGAGRWVKASRMTRR